MFRPLTFGATWLVALVCITVAVPAQDAMDGPGEPGATAAQRELVQQLGAPSFFTREQASERLAGQGATAKAVLMDALKDPDLEIRWRARRILNRVLQEAFEARLAAFIAGVDGKEQHGFPGWKRFRDLVGDRCETRTMFAQMTRSEGALLSAYEKHALEAPELFAARVAWLQSLAASGQYDARVALPERLATLLENKTVCHGWTNRALKKDGTIKVEVRDVALVVLLRMAGKDPVDYGFKLLKENPETLYYVHTFGFIDDEERETAHVR